MMAVFPDSIPHVARPVIRTGVTRLRTYSGLDYAVSRWGGRLLKSIDLEFGVLTWAEEQTLREFLEANHEGKFYYFESNPRMLFSGQAVDETATGSLDTFTLPAKETSGLTVYEGGVEVETGWSLSPASGANGEDQIVFDPGSEPSGAVTVDFAGRPRLYGYFDGDIPCTGNFLPGMTLPFQEAMS